MSADGTAPAAPDGALLLALARSAIAEDFGGARAPVSDDVAWLHEKRAVFCSLHLRGSGDLRGCVGQLVARFSPVREDELPHLRIDISVLSPLEPLRCETEADFLRQVRPGVDGVVLTHGFHSGLFIPQMWEQLPEKEHFLHHLKRKAGLPPGWQPGTKVERFTVVHWEEPP